MKYLLPWTPRKTSLVMWNSSSTLVWQSRLHGGERLKAIYFRRDYPNTAFLWGEPRSVEIQMGLREHCPRAGLRCRQNRVRGVESWPQLPDVLAGRAFPDGGRRCLGAGPRREVFRSSTTADNTEVQAEAAAGAAGSGKWGGNIVSRTQPLVCGRN